MTLRVLSVDDLAHGWSLGLSRSEGGGCSPTSERPVGAGGRGAHGRPGPGCGSERHPGWLLHRLGLRASVHVQGPCVGGGFELMSLAHRVVAASDTTFSLPEVAMGVVPGAGGTVGITKRAGRWTTAWLALSGTRLEVEQAQPGSTDEIGVTRES